MKPRFENICLYTWIVVMVIYSSVHTNIQ